ncbi:MAG: DNA recombination protein RmuC [Pseudomonadota bacterium]
MIYDFLTEAGFALGSTPFWVALALLSGLLLFLGLWAQSATRGRRLARQLEKTRIRLAGEEQRASEVEPLRASIEEERDRRALLESQAAANEARLAERERALEETKARLEAEFKATTADLLKGAHQSFLERAKETFDLYKETASSDGERRRKALDDMLRPVSETLVRYEKGLAELREEQHRSRGALSGQINALAQSTQAVQAEAQKLTTALKAGPKTRGRWGEEQLRNVVEIAGMAAHVDFVEQSSHSDGEKRKIPDMVVRLPGERVIAVDSKVSLGAYLDAVEAETDEVRAAALHRHADDLWAHAKGLAMKDYAATLRDSLDYVVLFLPGENFFSAALEVRPELYQKAFEQKILIASPTILIAVLKSAALNWRQERMTEYAQEVAALAKDLYDSLRTMAGNMKSLGRSLEGAVKNYNASVGGYEGRVLSRARKFAEYEIPGIDAPIDEVTPVEGALRDMRAQPDLLTDGKNKSDAA